MLIIIQNLATARAGPGSWKPLRDISRNIGVPLYAFSFFGNRLRRIKSLNLGCKSNDFKTIIGRFDPLKLSHQFSEKVGNVNTFASHPLTQLDPSLLPEVVIHQLEILKFR